MEPPLAALTPALLGELERLEPHGQGNPQPLVRLGPLRLLGPPRLFGKGNLAGLARGGDGSTPVVKLLGWGWQERQEELAGTFEVLGVLERDEEGDGPVLRLVDARPVVE
jgi:single-stranded-DNA-specific exonuclease